MLITNQIPDFSSKCPFVPQTLWGFRWEWQSGKCKKEVCHKVSGCNHKTPLCHWYKEGLLDGIAGECNTACNAPTSTLGKEEVSVDSTATGPLVLRWRKRSLSRADIAQLTAAERKCLYEFSVALSVPPFKTIWQQKCVNPNTPSPKHLQHRRQTREAIELVREGKGRLPTATATDVMIFLPVACVFPDSSPIPPILGHAIKPYKTYDKYRVEVN